MNRTASILIVDDEDGIRHGLKRLFQGESYYVETAETVEEANAVSDKKKFDLAIVDLRLKSGQGGMSVLDHLRLEDSEIPVIMITGYGSIESAIDAMKRGASDYVLKPVDNEALLEIVGRNLEVARLRRDNKFLKRELLQNVYKHEIITENPGLLKTISRIDGIKDSNASILITGESGTGKEVFARYIHFTSNRRDGPFVGINCAALSEELLLSELFGHERGAFTGAIERKIGKFELADKGTLFLDEIGDMSPSIQAKLLRVIEESAFERVGGIRKISVDIRIIAATNHDVHDLIRMGKFRGDLFYRIAIVEIGLPPLRERKEDIPLLAEFFVRMYAQRYRKKIDGIAPETMGVWAGYSWPGNIRELQNVVHQAVLLCPGNIVGGGVLVDSGRVPATAEFSPERYATLKDLSAAATAHYERERIATVLMELDGNRTRTSRKLGITRKTLLGKIKEYGLDQARQ
jgi:DNA-binding NtrC family response regulator